jgi:hypothetical protein
MPAESKLRSKTRPTRRRDVAKLHPVSDEMRQWCALLKSELLTWPNAEAKPMFGLRGFYRAKRIFAALPESREFEPLGAFLLKFDPMPKSLQRKIESDSRLGSWAHSGSRWTSFTLQSTDDLRDALWWLEQAYEHAKGKRSR